MSNRWAVAAGDKRTAEAAAEVLRAGGNAVDAVIAAALTSTVTEPVLSSLLGGGFLTVRTSSGETRVLDFFVQTPRRKRPVGELDFREIHADFGETTQAFHVGAGAIATPGVGPGLFTAHAALGQTPMPDLASFAVKAASEGVALTGFQTGVLEIVSPIYTGKPEARDLFAPDGRLLGAGETYRNPALADTLDTYAREGARFVTEGEAAQAVLAVAAEGGHLTADDLKLYQPVWRQPIRTQRGGVDILLNPPPNIGGSLIAFSLEMMENGAGAADIARAFHATSRARLESGLDDDPAAGSARLASLSIQERYRAKLAGRPAAVRGTTHISVVDAAGLAAGLTLSNGEGTGLIAPGIGMMPNNMLGEEDLSPHGFHLWPEDVRLSSMMAPTVVEWPNGRVAMLGSGGSNRIRTALAQTIRRILDDGASLEEAVEAPRVHVEGAKSPEADFEDRFPEGEREALLKAFPKARPWSRVSMFYGGVHAVSRDAKGGVQAAGDHRRSGAVRMG